MSTTPVSGHRPEARVADLDDRAQSDGRSSAATPGRLPRRNAAPVDAHPSGASTPHQHLQILFVGGSDSELRTSVLAPSHTEASVEVAIAALVERPFDCVVMDLDGDGTRTLAGLAEVRRAHPGVPIVGIADDDELARAALRAGAQDYVRHDELNGRGLERAVAYAVERCRSELSERRVDLLLNRTTEVVFVIDADRVVTFASASVTSVLGYRPEDLIGQPGAGITHPDDLTIFRNAVAGAIDEPDVAQQPVIVRARRVDGSWRWGEAIVVNLLHDPAVNGLVVNVRDVTEQYEALRLVETEQARRTAIVARSRDLVMFFESDGTISWASPASLPLFGVEPEDLVGNNGFELIHVDDRDRVFIEFLGIPNLGDHVRTEFRILDAHGEVRWVEEIATNLLDEPSVGAIVGNLRDVTDRKSAEEAIRFQARLLAAAGQPIIASDTSGRVLYWNEAATTTYGWTTAEAMGRQLSELLPAAEGWQQRADEISGHLREGGRWSGEFWVQRKDRTQVPVLVTNTPVFDEQAQLVATIGVSSDMTERMRLYDQIDTDRRRLADAQASAGLGSFEIDLDTGAVTRSDELYRILGVEPGSLSLVEFDHIHDDDREAVRAALDEAVTGRSAVECTHRIVRPDGEIRWVVSRSSRFHDPKSNVLRGTMLDITERREAELYVEQLAFKDQLTGLSNRTTLTALLDDALASGGNSDQRIVVALLDLDQFKVINDSLGHAAGDAMLQAVARRLESVLQPGETVARFGGDEFAVIRDGATTEAEGLELGRRLLASLEDAPIKLGEREFHMSMSIGVVLSRQADSADTLFRDADSAMYHAKDSGRGRVTIFDESLQVRSQRRFELASELRRALDRDQLRVLFQPILELGSLRTAGFEALLRWDHPTLGSIRPDEFVPIAEETGLILQIGDWVLQQSLREVAGWWADGPSASRPWVAVNLSAIQLERPDIVETIAAALSEAGVPPAALHLELTESVLMDDIDRSLEILQGLRELGIRVSIDDFGTGYSSLSYLRRFPIDTLKIDRSFINGLGSDPGNTSIVQAIVSLAMTLNMNVLAEGVETDTQLRSLVELGCDFGQGFLWSEAVPSSEVAQWLEPIELH